MAVHTSPQPKPRHDSGPKKNQYRYLNKLNILFVRGKHKRQRVKTK